MYATFTSGAVQGPAEPVTLDNCASEPIHIPGHIQPHGALLAFDLQGRLAWASSNASALLGVGLPAVGQPIAPAHFGRVAAVREAFAAEAAADEQWPPLPLQREVLLGDRRFDMVVHRVGRLVVGEFEPRADNEQERADFAAQAHHGIEKLRRQRSIDALLETAVQEVRALTGFDRVMAYRFRPDDSGDVVAEARAPALPPLVGHRYPAGDIPAQARRLYLLNTLRVIADVHATAVPVLGTPPQPLDMSHCHLRSVSPVHIEYLRNMGVGASMSVSIVVGGRLWGMLACHHMAPRRVRYGVRMACEVLAQIVAANVQSLLHGELAARAASAASLRARMVERMLHAEDSLAALLPLVPALAHEFSAQAVVLLEGEELSVHGAAPAQAVRALLGHLDATLPSEAGELIARDSLQGVPPALAQPLGAWCGLLALRFDRDAPAWLALLRREQVETVAWAGPPEKIYTSGPLGPRLTPRGSFETWREEVRGKAVPWSAADLEMARELQGELARAVGARHAELSRARDQMLAVLGHDLRTPLQTISMAAHGLARGADASALGHRIQRSSTRMQRLIAQVLDTSRLQAGLGLGFSFAPVDVPQLAHDIADDELLAHPGLAIERDIAPAFTAPADADRLAQLLGNLLSNARHHGEPDRPIVLVVRREGGEVVLQVRNQAPPIPPALTGRLFAPFKRQSLGNDRNRTGLGLGLYIAREIARGHGGTLVYEYHAPWVVFTARWPTRR
ncbi:GAF domain-containing protein [Ramlibacter tataouinensis]|uniref:histidine kinase n=1 Tax=Ramlibacter tataouinensis (strain ATCC BAA-407 / DSM 14655 / LMG 21543 / TTB310) TaxID=365046 RepID=F5Y6C4_RAMTT|nr:GAF domain-containing protein [Ramlibacter tataouinensis]AEG93998.1 candidate histidine kinase, classic [Ramlibacter tataouinensis TTB310]